MTEGDFKLYCDILLANGFTKEEFLFNSKPYIKELYCIIKKIGSLGGLNLLDFGCGPGLTSFLLAKEGFHVVGLDIYDIKQNMSLPFIKSGKERNKCLWGQLERDNLKFRFYNGKNTVYKNKGFDIVFAHAVLEHIDHIVWTALELCRILKPGGFLVIARTPNKYALTEFLKRSHTTLFTRKELKDIFYPLKEIYYKRTDFFPEVFPKCQGLVNKLTPVIHILDNLISRTPLSIFSHHHFMILQKER